MSCIAVLIPSYKPKDYIERCFQSLDAQDLSKNQFKVYIALNGPKEDYEDYLFTCLKNVSFNYQYFYLPEAGVSGARNFLIDNSTEPFITFIDDDDCVSGDFLKNLLMVSGEEIIGISNVRIFKEDPHKNEPNYIGKSFSTLQNIETSKFKARKYFSSPCAKLIHRKIINQTRFDKKLSVGEDALFMTLLSKNIIAIRKTSETSIYYVFQRDGSATRKNINKMEEINRLVYLLHQYCILLFTPKYNVTFILSRIAATFKHFLRLI